MSSDITSSHDENQESGLGLWHGTAPLQPSPPEPPSRVQQFVDPIVSALRRGGWMALPAGVALILLAVILRSTPPDTPAPADTAGVALEPVPPPADAHAVIPAPPVDISAPRVEHSDTALEQAQMASAPVALSPASGTEHLLAKKAAHHTLPRAVRKTHAFADRGSPFSIRGVLTPPDPTAWPGGGH